MIDLLNRWKPRLGTVFVDSAGIGYNFGLHLQDLGFRVSLVNVGSAAVEPERFVNSKVERYWQLREKLKAGSSADSTTRPSRS